MVELPSDRVRFYGAITIGGRESIGFHIKKECRDWVIDNDATIHIDASFLGTNKELYYKFYTLTKENIGDITIPKKTRIISIKIYFENIEDRNLFLLSCS